MRPRDTRVLGGLALIAASLALMLLTGAPIPVPVTFLVVGFALIVQSRRGDRTEIS